jgi:uncharacterized membrane protein
MTTIPPPPWLLELLSEADLAALMGAVAEAEARTSGEIRVHLDPRCPGAPLARAVEVFERIGMARTAERNGVLVYLAIADRKLAVIGDAGIHARVPADYWERLRDDLARRLREGRPREGLIAAVAAVGETLRRHFPRGPDDRNELSDAVSVD